MVGEGSPARHAHVRLSARRLLAVIGTAGALVAGIVLIGSTFTGGDGDDTVTLLPTTDPSPKGVVDDTPPPDDTPTGVPTAASTVGPSPAPAATQPDRDAQSPPPDRSEPDDPASPKPAPRPRSTHPGRSPSSPPHEPEPDPTQSDDPEPSPDPTPSDDPESEPACAADARIERTDLFGFGFTASVTITNESTSTLTDWTSAFTLPGGYRITHAKNAEVIEGGKHAVVRGTGTAAVIGAGASATFEITTSGAGQPDEPSNISVNGVACR